MADFIAKLGIDASGFITGMESAASKAGAVESGLSSVTTQANKAAQAMQSAGNSGGAFDSLKSKIASVGSSFGDLGKSVLGVFGGGALVAGLGGIGSAFGSIIEGAREADDAADSLAISLAKAGLSGQALVDEQERLTASAKKTADEFALPTTEVTKLQAKIAGFSGATGSQLTKLTEFSIGAANALQMPAESVAKLLGKAADPESEAKLKALGIVFDKNATSAEKMEIINAKLGPTIQATKDSTQDAIGTFDRITNSVREFSVELASGLFDAIGEILQSLSPFVDAFKAAFAGAGDGIGGFVTNIKNAVIGIIGVLAPIGTVIIDSIVTTIQTMWGIVEPIIMGLYNAFLNVKNAILPASESTASFKDTMATLAPIIQAVVSVMTVVGAIMAANYVRTQLMTAANVAYTAVTGGMQAIISGVSTAQTLLNAVMAANPIGAVVVAVAALAAGFYVLYQKSETFRNIIASIWDWIKKAASMFVELQLKFNPIIGLFRLAYDNIKPFRDAVDYAIEKVMKLWDAVKGVAGAIGSFFSTAEESKPPAKKEEKKPAEPIAVGATVETTTDTADAAEKASEASKKIVDSKQKELQLATASLVADQQKTENAIKQLAIDEKRNLTDKEKETILNSQLKLTNDIEAATRRILKVTGEGSNIKIGLKLTPEAAAEMKIKVMADLAKLSDEKIKIGTEFVKLSDEQKKELSDAIKQAASEIKDGLKEALTFKTFVENPLEAYGKITSGIQQLRDKANAAATIGNQKLSDELLAQANEYQSKLSALLTEVNDKRIADEKARAAEAAQAQAKRRSDIENLYTRKIEEEKIASAKRVAANTELLDALKREEAALYESLRKREIGYEEFSTKLVDIEARRAAAQAKIQTETTSAFSQTMNGAVKATNELIASELNKLTAQYNEQFNKQLESGTASLDGLAEAAATQFGAMVVSGQNAGDALKEVSKGVVGKLIDMYVAPVILSTISFLGPLALPVATALVASAKSLFASAIAGFQDGGYTGNAGTSDIAGVVHGQEFVHSADVTRKHRGLFEHLHKGGELSSWMVTTAGALQAPAVSSPRVSTYGIESRLDRLEMAINRGNRKFESMRAVQMTVEHDPTLTIKAQSRNLEIRSARA